MRVRRHPDREEEAYGVEVGVRDRVVKRLRGVLVAELPERELLVAARSRRAEALGLGLELESSSWDDRRLHVRVEVPVLSHHLGLELRVDAARPVFSEVQRGALLAHLAARGQIRVVWNGTHGVAPDLPEDSHGVELPVLRELREARDGAVADRKSTRLNSSHLGI